MKCDFSWFFVCELRALRCSGKDRICFDSTYWVSNQYLLIVVRAVKDGIKVAVVPVLSNFGEVSGELTR